MKLAVPGGHGFVGWPTALHPSNLGPVVQIVDNLSRRRTDTEPGVPSLRPMDPIRKRCRIWHDLTAQRLHVHLLDLARDDARMTA